MTFRLLRDAMDAAYKVVAAVKSIDEEGRPHPLNFP